MYYNLKFWLFLGHFWTFLGLVIISPEMFLGRSTWLVTVRGCFAPFVLPRKASKHLICSFLVKPKIVSIERKDIHIFVTSHITPLQWPPMALGDIPWRHSSNPEKVRNVFYNLKFKLFWRCLDLSGPGHVFSPNIPRKAEGTCNIAWVLDTICIALKAFEHPISSFLVKPKIVSKWT